MHEEDFKQHIAPWLALHDCAGIGPLRANQLMAYFGSPAQIFAQPVEVLADALGSRRYAQALLQAPSPKHHATVQQALQWLNSPAAGVQGMCKAIITQHDPRYPDSLKEIADPPLFVYALGAASYLHDDAPIWWRHCRGLLAMVGSRAPTGQGLMNAKRISADLQEAGICIVSGLARGIDAAAHEGALTSASGLGPATVAIMGTGIDRIYPLYHHDLAQRIASKGLLLSEQAIGMGPLASHFPKRNRIITGISQATLVVEATEQSGSLISARLAAEQGRDVMAIPGSIHAPQSKGCHWLIKQGAKLVENAADVAEDFAHALALPTALTSGFDSAIQAHAVPPAGSGPAQPQIHRPMPAPEQAPRQGSSTHAVLQRMGYDPINLEQLQATTGLPTAALQAALLELELAQRVSRLPGGIYQRIEQA